MWDRTNSPTKKITKSKTEQNGTSGNVNEMAAMSQARFSRGIDARPAQRI